MQPTGGRRAWAAALVATAWLGAAECGTLAEGQTFDSWTVRCEQADEGAARQCFIYQNVVLREGGQRVLHIAVGLLPGLDDPIALVTLPLGISLPPGARLEVEGHEPARLHFERCEPQGCRAGIRLRDDLLAAFREGSQARITFYDAHREPITIPLSLAGFADGLDALRQAAQETGGKS